MALRTADVVMTAALDQRLRVHPDDGTFDEAEVAGLDEPVRRYLCAAIAPGTRLARAARLHMRGSIKLGDRWVGLRGISMPAHGTGGWFHGTDRWPEGEFMRYSISELVPV